MSSDDAAMGGRAEGRRSPPAVAGDDLPALLEGPGPLPPQILVEPPPSSWAAIKPRVLGRLRSLAREGRALPRFERYPLCALDSEDLDFPTVTSRAAPLHAACHGCGAAHLCSPPRLFSDELSPYGPRDPYLAWTRHHDRLCTLAGIARDERLDRLVEVMLAGFVGPLAGAPPTVEPSTLFKEDLLPSVRLALFHGEHPRGERARPATTLLFDTFLTLHEVAGCAPPRSLVERLRAHPPMAIPFGFESAPGRPLLLKAYCVTTSLSVEDKRRLLGDLLAASGAERPALDVDLDLVDMFGLGTVDGALAIVKAYVRGDPRRAWPEASLPALDASHPAVSLSGAQAYAVVDLCATGHAAGRANKWDFRVRDQLLTGPRIAPAFSSVLAPGARLALSRLFEDTRYRVDTNAVGIRGDQTAFYTWLG